MSDTITGRETKIDSRDATAFSVFRYLIASRRVIFISGIVVSLVSVLVSNLRKEYEVQAKVILEQKGQRAPALSGLAAQIGIQMPQSGVFSIQYFGEILRSREVLDTLAFSKITGDSDSNLRFVDVLLSVHDSSRSVVGMQVVSNLRSRLSVSQHPASGIITVRMRMPDADLAESALMSLLTIADRAHMMSQQAAYRAERSFGEARLAEAEGALHDAQNALSGFMEANRSYGGSAFLEIEAANLQRLVDLRQAVLTGIVQAVEQARFEEVRNTPFVRIVETPIGSAVSTFNLGFQLKVGVLLGLVLGVIVVLLGYMRSVLISDDSSGYTAFAEECGRAIRDPFSIQRR